MKANTYVKLLTILVAILVAGIGTGLDLSTNIEKSKSLWSDGDEGIVPGDAGGEGIVPGDAGDEGIPHIDPGVIDPYDSGWGPIERQETAYIGGITIPSASYQTTISKYLWIENDNKLLQYASIPQYASLSLIAYTSTGGPGEILEMFPSDSNQGVYQRTLYKFNPGNNRIPYRSDVVGRHHLLFNLNDQSSNGIIIDVNNGMIGGSPVMLGTMPSEGA